MTCIASEVSLPPAATINVAEFIAESSLAPREFEVPNSGQGDRPDFKAGISEETTDIDANFVDDALVDTIIQGIGNIYAHLNLLEEDGGGKCRKINANSIEIVENFRQYLKILSISR